MKVIHLIGGGDTGGAKTHVHSLLRGLAQQSVQADLVCFLEGPFAQEARELGIRVEVMPRRNPLAVLKPLQARIQAEGYDVIHCHGSRANLIGALLKPLTGLPIVTTVHSDPKSDYLGRPLSAATYGTLNAWALRRFSYYIAVSGVISELLIERGFDPQSIFSIRNGLQFPPSPPALDRQAFLASLGLDWPADAVIVGIAARLNPVKDMGTLLRGFAAARREQPALRLIIAGEGPEEEPLRRLARELGVTEQVCFAGWVSDTDSFYHALDINALTSLSEGLPYVLVEGARFALPTVATDVGGVPQIIRHDETGILFPAQDHEALSRALAALAADPALRRRLGEGLLDSARAEYSIDTTVRQQIEIYQTILRRQARPRDRDGVVICGAYGQDNAGDEAVLKAALAELRAIDPDLPLCVMTRHPKQTRLAYRTQAVYTFNFPGFLRKMSRSRLYLNGGGSLIQDVTSRRSLLFYLYTLHAAKRRGCRVLMYGCGIGPVNRPGSIDLTRRVLNRCVDLVTLREDYSLKELRGYGVTVPEILLSADPALSLKPAGEAEIDGLMRQCGLDPHGQYLCLCLRQWPGFEEKLPAIVQAVRHGQQRGLTPVFLSINPSEDGAAAQKAVECLDEPACIINRLLSSELTLGLMSRMQAVISMRLHGLIFAAGQGTPLVGLVYDPKVSAFLAYMGQELYMDLADVTSERLCQALDRALALGEDREALKAAVERLRAMESNNSAALRRLLSDSGEEEES